MQRVQTYRGRSRAYLAKARQELQAGDLEQASEKGWGAAALMVKAMAEQRGEPHRSHALLFDVVDRLVEETGDEDLDTLFIAANGLHTNFYENHISVAQVRRGIQRVQEFVEKLEQMLDRDL